MDVARLGEHQAPRLGVVHERFGHDVGRELVHRRGQAQELVRPVAVERDDRARPPAPRAVSVPVLSSSTVRTRPSCSITPAPFTTMPERAARETPDTSAIGAARMSGQGVATTSTARARTASPLNAHAPPASSTVTGSRNAA